MIDSEQEDSEEYPEGYTEALAQCTVLAVRLLKMMTECSAAGQLP
jgi:hypothetical protein